MGPSVEELTSLCLIDVEYRFIRTTDFFHELNTQTLHGDIPKFKEGELWDMKRSEEKGFTYQLYRM